MELASVKIETCDSTCMHVVCAMVRELRPTVAAKQPSFFSWDWVYEQTTP